MKVQPSTLNVRTPAPDRLVGTWLAVVAGMIAVMVVVGGLTRLTDSGLSITEWNLVTGVIPPMTDAMWLAEFEKYRAIPEYQIQNRGMSLDDFKLIYWWEWGHRALGRLIGLAFVMPFLGLLVAGRLRPDRRWIYAALFLGIALQGAIGWWMVSSGLVDRIDVSQYRLAVHLGLAFLLFAAMVWAAADALSPAPQDAGWRGLALAGVAFGLLLFAQILLGAIVAGLDAGRIHTGWPLVEGRFIPAAYAGEGPWWLNAFENRAAAQTHHRLAGYGLAIAAPLLAWASVRRGGAVAVWGLVLGAGVLIQVVLGIITLVHVAPVGLSAAHQAMAVALTACLVMYLRAARRSPPAPRAGPAR